ncbi:macrolide family glycosyltransferase [Cohnella fermenti]|uniref:Glycosyl transferase family 1 n=1 Tax=Cohnella fermenti TaxID=2565925 RepID=A0A4S4C3H6_9BACL|nr:macrolide family glycosyltransferase [Cohnella fermenti]THF82200.1 glycosyl transferase family 1 [Cohnella fermenti]
MARVLFINAGSEGHINPTIGVVRELVSRGEEVVYFCIEEYRERMEQAGAVVRTFDGQRFIRAFVSGGRNYPLERVNGLLLTADVVIPSVLEQIKGERFDYMIHDTMFGCGSLLARMLGLPAIGSCTSFAQDRAAFERMLEASEAQAPADAVGAARDRYAALKEAILGKYGVEAGAPYETFCNPAPLTLVYTTREFQPDGPAFGSGYAFVGPSIAPRAVPGDFDWAAIEGRKPIYISLGTVFNQAPDFYRLCFEAFKNAGRPVVLSAGERTRLSDLGDIPASFIVRSYVPQTEVLRHAGLFITHGGMNSVHEGLYCGVPLVVVPQGADQPVIAERVSQLGAGIRLQMQGLTAEGLREAADRALSDASYAREVERVGESFRRAGGFRQAADRIAEFKQRHSIQ